MHPIIYFDISAVIILMLLLFTIRFKRMTRGTENRVFLTLVIISFVAAVFSLITAIMATYPSYFGKNAHMVLHFIYLVSRNMIGLTYVVYIIAISDTWHKFMKSMVSIILLLLPYVVVVACLIENFWTENVFYMDDKLTYLHGDKFFILYISAVFYIIFGMTYLHKYRRLVRFDKRVALYALIPITIASLIIQLLYTGMLVEMFATAVSVLFFMITIQRPEDVVDSYTGLKKRATYNAEITRSFESEKEFDVIAVNILNYNMLLAMFGLESEYVLLGKLAKVITEECQKCNFHAQAYYLDRGRFRFALGERHRKYTDTLAKDICSRLNEDISFNGAGIRLTFNISVTRCPADAGDYHSFFMLDNEIENIVKTSGSVTYVSDVVKDSHIQLNAELDNIIEDALANRKFEVYYQPIFSVKDNRFTSSEALLRLKNEKYGFIPPDVFIAAAEKSGAIYRLGEYVLTEVCSFISGDEFKSLGLEYIEVNLSVAQCMQSELADTVIRIMNEYNVKPEQINLEITETAASYAQNVMMDNLEKLSDAGISFSLDDYGTGYSNIKRVASLPLKIVKLDKTFVSSEGNTRLWIILKNTITMLKEMNMEIVVEGVETKDLADNFSQLECEYIQGYYYSKPIPKQQFIEFILNDRKVNSR